MWASRQTIHQAIYAHTRGELRTRLAREVALRSGRTVRRTQSRGARAGRGAHCWVGGFHISTRPAEAATGPCPGTGKGTW